MSAALVIFAMLSLARLVLVAVVACVALATKDSTRRATAVAILPMLRTVPTLQQSQPTENN